MLMTMTMSNLRLCILYPSVRVLNLSLIRSASLYRESRWQSRKVWVSKRRYWLEWHVPYLLRPTPSQQRRPRVCLPLCLSVCVLACLLRAVFPGDGDVLVPGRNNFSFQSWFCFRQLITQVLLQLAVSLRWHASHNTLGPQRSAHVSCTNYS